MVHQNIEIRKTLNKSKKESMEPKKNVPSDSSKEEKSNKDDKNDQGSSKEAEKIPKKNTEERTLVEKMVIDKYKSDSKDMDERQKKLSEEGYGGARRKRARQKQKHWRDSSLTRTPPVKHSFVSTGEVLPSSEPSIATRGPMNVGSPPSYKRFDSPKPPPTVKSQSEDKKAGILRADLPSITANSSGSSRRKSSRSSLIAQEAISPAPSADRSDRLSVTFAMDDVSIEEVDPSDPPCEVKPLKMSDNEVIVKPTSVAEKEEEILKRDSMGEFPAIEGGFDFSGDSGDEYADSVFEIARSLSRNGSLTGSGARRGKNYRRKRGRRKSSGRRLSSAFSGISAITSSGASVATGGLRIPSQASSKSAERDALKIHKEVIEQARYQLWPLDKKLRVVRQAKDYLDRHASEVEQRLAQDRTFKGRLQTAKLKFIKWLQMVWKLIQDIADHMIPWQQRIKDIESHFGSVVSSYFVFLRWIFWMNFAITLVLMFTVILPEVISASWEGTGARKKMLPVESIYSNNFKVMWDFDGFFRYSPMFYGYYSKKNERGGYNIPLAYFCAEMIVYIFSFYIILRKMAANTKQSKLSAKDEECTFTWKIFTSWDYGIANVETAHNKVASIIMSLRESLVEESAKEKEKAKNWETIAKRVLANLIFVLLLLGSAYLVIWVVERSQEKTNSWYRQNEITIVMSLIGMIMPMFFDLIALLEEFHPRKAMRWMLARIMALNLLSLYTLIFALFGKTHRMSEELIKMKNMSASGMADYGLDFGMSTEAPMTKDCFNIPIPCQMLSRVSRLPPILSLIYDYDENGVILKRQQDMNGTMVDLGENLFIPTDNLTEFLNLNHNESVQMQDIFSLQDLLQGTNETYLKNIFEPTQRNNTIYEVSIEDEDLTTEKQSFLDFENWNSYFNPGDGTGFVDYDQRNGSCSECEDFCGLTCFPVCLFFQSSDCRIPDGAYNHSDFPQYFQLKTALEENNSYIGSHIDDCYQCVEKFSRFDPDNYDEFYDGDNHTRKDPDLFTTSHLNQNGYNVSISSLIPWILRREKGKSSTTENGTNLEGSPTNSSILEGRMGRDNFSSEVPPTKIDLGLIPLDERACTKKICKRFVIKSSKSSLSSPGEEPILALESVLDNCPNAESKYFHDIKDKLHIRKLCWETMFGQELVKLTVMDTVFTVAQIFIGDFFRSFFLRVMNPIWCCFDLEKSFPKYPDFSVAENILHLVNNQGMIWMGLFMAPGLPALNLIKLAILMYLRSWAVMCTNVPHETVFKASKSNNFYFALLLLMLFLCTLPVAYSVVWLTPSFHCGPFSDYDLIYKVFSEKVMQILPKDLHVVLDYITSPGVVIPTLVLMILVIYNLISTSGLLKDANEDLKEQLHYERTEARRKLLKDQGKTQDEGENNKVSDRWKRVLGSALSSIEPKDDSKPQATSLLSRVVALNREKNKAIAEGSASRQSNGDGDEDYSERGIDIPGSLKGSGSRKGSRKNKKSKQGQYVIDIEPMVTPKMDDVEGEDKVGEVRKDDEEKKSSFIRGASGRSTMDGSVMSGSLDVHFHTGAAPSPIYMEVSDHQDTKNQAIEKAKTYLETELPVYEKENHENTTNENMHEKSNEKENVEEIAKEEDKNQVPPQVWISKSLSMEQGLNVKDDE